MKTRNEEMEQARYIQMLTILRECALLHLTQDGAEVEIVAERLGLKKRSHCELILGIDAYLVHLLLYKLLKRVNLLIVKLVAHGCCFCFDIKHPTLITKIGVLFSHQILLEYANDFNRHCLVYVLE